MGKRVSRCDEPVRLGELQGLVPLMGQGHAAMPINDNAAQQILSILALQLIHAFFAL
jgi:hypothetical protein